MPPDYLSLILEDSTSSGSPSSASHSRKRKRSLLYCPTPSESYGLTSQACDFDDVETSAVRSPLKKTTIRSSAVAVQVPGFAFPKSLYNNDQPTDALFDERHILNEFLQEEDTDNAVEFEAESNTFLSVDLENYSIYRSHKTWQSRLSGEFPLANRLVSLHELYERQAKIFLFDGLVCFGGHRRYVRGVPIDLLSIGGIGLERATAGMDIWIQSFEGKRRDLWYRLGKPAPEYEQYQQPFLWVADLAKHIVDYLHVHPSVHLRYFRKHFHGWLRKVHLLDLDFIRWLETYNNTDFRSTIVAHANFLYCQNAPLDENYGKHPLWAEIWSLTAVSEQIEDAVPPEMKARIEVGQMKRIESRRKTTVTPYVNRCFARMPWARLLHSSNSQGLKVPLAKATIEIPTNGSRSDSRASVKGRSNHWGSKETLRRPIQTGNVVAIEKDQNGPWKTQDSEYYAYVQDVKDTIEGRCLNLLWLYKPGDTACKKMTYPFDNELFLSDHCNCGDKLVYEHDVIHLPFVTFFGSPISPSCDFFCRQQYIEGEGAWQTLRTDHFRCRCHIPPTEVGYRMGDTLLVKALTEEEQLLEPAILTEHVAHVSGDKMRVRRLPRRGRDYSCPNSAPNELVWTDRFDIIPRSNVERRCNIRFFSEQQKEQGKIPHPYNKRGMGDFFFIVSQDCSGDLENLTPEVIPELLPLPQPWPSPIRQGWIPENSVTRIPALRGLDIFCGGGSFGRGLEDGCAVEFQWAVDNYSEAIHTYKANVQDESKIKLFRGSVNGYLLQAMAKKGIGLVAQKGEVDVIISGNPCQGFSTLNPLKGVHDQGSLNQSLVASTVSFIDFYRPKYAILENVLGMACGGDSENVLAQVLCALVGIGYQVKTFILDAWNFSSPQSRSRVFVTCTAAGLEPLDEPPHTHSHPEEVRSGSLGKVANGQRVGSRFEMPTPFEYISAEEATNDLPATDDRTSCISVPDHRTSISLSTLDRIRLECVPRHPAGMSFIKSFERGCMPRAQIDNFGWDSRMRSKKDSKCWTRIRRNGLIPTVTTAPRPSDGAAGSCVHWDQHRVLTIMEARRAQGFPDDEVIIGEKAQQYKIVGNSVARPVAFALGLALRKAWLANSEKTEEQSRTVADTVALECKGTPSIKLKEDEDGNGSLKKKPRWGRFRREANAEANNMTSPTDEKTPFQLVSNPSRSTPEDMKDRRNHSRCTLQTAVPLTSPSNFASPLTPERDQIDSDDCVKHRAHVQGEQSVQARSAPKATVISPKGSLTAPKDTILTREPQIHLTLRAMSPVEKANLKVAFTSKPQVPVSYLPRAADPSSPSTPTPTSPQIRSKSGCSQCTTEHSRSKPPIVKLMNHHMESSSIIVEMDPCSSRSPPNTDLQSSHSSRRNSLATRNSTSSSPMSSNPLHFESNTIEASTSSLGVYQSSTTIPGNAVCSVD